MIYLTLYWQVEIKNLNSFSSINRAIDFEISRQVLLHSQGQGDSIVQETRLWEEGSQVKTAYYFHSSVSSSKSLKFTRLIVIHMLLYTV